MYMSVATHLLQLELQDVYLRGVNVALHGVHCGAGGGGCGFDDINTICPDCNDLE